ncbi:aldehyde dehydrogenase family protein [Arthrobacter sp. TPD3018]|uniref:aldehyde dehydrogenase family protein n=1 Tax=Bacteria TaxID=2 RepID=UPI000D518DA5|nr:MULTISPECIES: aldehyde dehydrogenase family protein [Bacteria]PVE52801.1 aldehyde dehydrogenase family protein [Sphingomonas sp. TPD3009]PVE52988.1 aldehyde dehydrogenase family protein [Arthrobacter sp. TPD3018]PVE81373.1 aldehyde dehydrogenase family protein [Sphingomonas melonis]
MRNYLDFYIDGRWTPARDGTVHDVIDPARERVAGRITLGTPGDVDLAVAAARRAFNRYSLTTREERLDLLERVLTEYQARESDMAAAITEEMGAPQWLATQMQAWIGRAHVETAIAALRDYRFEEQRGPTLVAKEPIGVCAFITPWNWPVNQIACKVMPALAVGCTCILKPSEEAPFSAQIWAEIMHAAGVPAGVFNLVNGTGPVVGAALSRHPDVDMISFTGSTRAGVEVARDAAPTVKRVHQELGGKSANIVLPDAPLEQAVSQGVKSVMLNSGQSCNAPTRLLVPHDARETARAAAAQAAAETTVGAPGSNAAIGPVVSEVQWQRIQRLIQCGIDEGATLVAGGTGRPEGLETGYYVKPTVFADVTPDMTIAREEIFGPVVAILEYTDEEDAIRIANDTVYGLAAYVQSADLERARAVARRLRAGQVSLNYPDLDMNAPFGGYKQSGNGREWGEHAFGEFLETKAIIGYDK